MTVFKSYMPIQIYNSLTRKKEEFIPLNPQEIKMYACGPTVYDEPHIGHARSAYIFDVIRRYLTYKEYKVKFVRNVTDVDDKIINKAKEEFPGEDLNSSFKKVADKYLLSYHEALKSLNIGEAGIIEPKASDYIPRMLTFIQRLIDKGAAYVSAGDVYFDITKAKNYGKLSNQSLEKMESGVRVAPNENKRNPLDFALWKSAKENEPSWDSPWGSKGRPGWHIECSVMSSDILGDEFDIHGGGIDLIFPHHENEIAQSEAAGEKFARYWIHHGLLTINGQKMSKSLGNFVTVENLLKDYHPDALKIFFLKTHYSHPVDYTNKKMQEETQCYKSFVYLFRYYEEYSDKKLDMVLNIEDKKTIDGFRFEFEAAMEDDFNTPQALAVLEKLKSYAYPFTVNEGLKANWLKFKYSVDMIRNLMNDNFGIFPDRSDPEKDLRLVNFELRDIIVESFRDTESINKKVNERIKLKKEKRFTEADNIRKELESKGIILEDTKNGESKWRWK